MTLRSIRPSFYLISLIFVTISLVSMSAWAQSHDDVWVSEPAIPVDINKTLLDLPPARAWQAGDPIQPTNPRKITNPDALTRPIPDFVPQRDPLVDLQILTTRSPIRAFNTPDVNVAGQPHNGFFPPDTIGAIGPTHYIQMINNVEGASVQVYDKNTGATVGAPISLRPLAPDADPCRTSTKGDPVPMFDQFANRWVLTEFVDGKVGNHLCVYISNTADPTTSTWKFYRFDTPLFPDYPKYAVWPDAYYIGSNETGITAVYAVDRAAMLAGNPATMIRRTTDILPAFSFQVMAPVDVDGPTPPPPGSPGIFVRHRDDEVHDQQGTPGSDKLEIWEFRADFNTPSNSTFNGPTNILVSEFESELCGLTSFECFPQPGVDKLLDPLREPVMNRPVYRNFGTHQTIVGNFTTDVDGGEANRGGVRWFELRRSAGMTSGGWGLHQEGTVSANDGLSRWMGSLAMDKSGNIALGYSTSGPGEGQYPSLVYTGRQSSDPSGTMPQAESVIIAGGDSQTLDTRWGDYSAMTVDPVDDCTFWFTSMYVPTDSQGSWETRVARFKFDSCGGTSNVTLQFTFCGKDDSKAEARGYITFDGASMSNPFSGTLPIPGSEILDLSVTVTGAASGNGTFAMNDFNGIAWDSNSSTMDFSKELVGQPTVGAPWGTVPSSGEAGDFNLTSSNSGVPSGTNKFTLVANAGTADQMTLKSMVPGPASNGTASCGAGPDSELKNLSTRAEVGTGAETAIAGFIIKTDVSGDASRGSAAQKCVVVRGRGPSMNVNNVPLLQDPTLTLYSGQTIIAQNDNWMDQENPADKTIIENLNLAPQDFREAALYKCLPQGAFTAFLRGLNGGVGVGIVEVFDADDGSAIMENISTRAKVGSGPLVTIGGFIIEGTAPRKILVRGRGPSVGVPAGQVRLNNPRLRLYQLLQSGNTLLRENDNWGDAPNAGEISASGQAPPDPSESAILMTLDPGVYTGIVDGIFGATGLGIIEVIDLSLSGTPADSNAEGVRLLNSAD
jgi:hypothetical protein